MATNDPVNSRSRSPGGGWYRRPIRAVATVAASVLVLVGATSTAASAQDRPAGPAPLMATGQEDAIPGRYIVVLRDSQPQQDMAARRTAAPAAALTRARTRGVQVRNEYRYALSGFSATLSASQLTDIRNDPDVAYVTADVQSRNDGIESAAPWGLDRIDQASPTLSGTYNYNADGAGVTVFVVDGGIRATHQDFGGRVGAGVDFVGDGHGTDDCNGHGTNVASIIGGTKYGVAKAVTMVPVRITGCNGSGAAGAMLAAIDWVTGNHPGRTGLANMSVDLSTIIPAVHNAMNRSLTSGVVWTLSAGNDNVDACTHSPTDTVGAITVGSIDRSGARDPNSNFGGCLTMFAPGVGIPGAGIASDTATSLFTGTSQAAPHVAGVAALYMQNRPRVPYWVIQRNLRAMGQSGVVSNAGTGSPNLLLSSRPLYGSSVALSRNNDSTLQMIGATTDGGLMWSNQTSISATTWTAPAAGGGTNTFALASSAGAITSDGWNIQFMLDIYGQSFTTSKASTRLSGSSWTAG
jgi:aqualysin 1